MTILIFFGASSWKTFFLACRCRQNKNNEEYHHPLEKHFFLLKIRLKDTGCQALLSRLQINDLPLEVYLPEIPVKMDP